MLQTILNWCQPLTVVVFIVSGVISLALNLKVQGAINLCLALTNFFIFYGSRFLK